MSLRYAKLLSSLIDFYAFLCVFYNAYYIYIGGIFVFFSYLHFLYSCPKRAHARSSVISVYQYVYMHLFVCD